jgi:Intracellular proteinase inhibitor
MGSRLLGCGTCVALPFLTRASVVLVTTMTDKLSYLPYEPITVFVTADNPSPNPLTLQFSSSLQASYTMDGAYDWTEGWLFLQVFTEVTIQPFSSHTWDLEHDWLRHAPQVGLHWVTGYLPGYGQSQPAQ